MIKEFSAPAAIARTGLPHANELSGLELADHVAVHIAQHDAKARGDRRLEPVLLGLGFLLEFFYRLFHGLLLLLGIELKDFSGGLVWRIAVLPGVLLVLVVPGPAMSIAALCVGFQRPVDQEEFSKAINLHI